MRFKNKVAIVTGGSSGIGRVTAMLFSKEGARVAVSCRTKEKGERVAREIEESGGEAIFVKADVSKAFDAENLIETTMSRFGRVDILFNNAGISMVRPVHEFTEDEWDKIVDTNLKGAFLCSKYAIPCMMKQGGGSIINTGSIWSFNAYPGFSAYCASKGGLLLLTRAMAVDLAPYNIRVNCVCPGAVDTEQVRGSLRWYSDPEKALRDFADTHPIRRLGKPEEIGKAVLFLASDEASWITGADLSIDGGRKARDRSLHDIGHSM